MPTAETILRAVRDAAKARKSETGERNAIQATLARYGHLKLPKMYQGRVADGRSIRVYVWEEALEAGPEGDLLLVTGPDIEGEVHPARAVGFRAEGGQAVFTEAVPWGGKGKSQAEAGLTRAGQRAVAGAEAFERATAAGAQRQVVRQEATEAAHRAAAAEAAHREAAARAAAAKTPPTLAVQHSVLEKAYKLLSSYLSGMGASVGFSPNRQPVTDSGQKGPELYMKANLPEDKVMSYGVLEVEGRWKGGDFPYLFVVTSVEDGVFGPAFIEASADDFNHLVGVVKQAWDVGVAKIQEQLATRRVPVVPTREAMAAVTAPVAPAASSDAEMMTQFKDLASQIIAGLKAQPA